MWLAGGGVKAGLAHGATDDLGYHAIDNVVHIRDLHATMLHTLGVDHRRLTFPFQGLNMKLTGVEEARVVRDILTLKRIPKTEFGSPPAAPFSTNFHTATTLLLVW